MKKVYSTMTAALILISLPLSAVWAGTSDNPFTKQLDKEITPELREQGGSSFIPEQGKAISVVLFVLNWVNILLTFLGIATVGLLIYAGALWMTAGGQSEQIEKAKKTLRNAIIGLIIIISSYSLSWWLILQIQRATGAIGPSSFSGFGFGL